MLPLFSQVSVTLDLSRPMDLTRAISPDLLLCGGAMIMLLYAAWRPESEAHQRRVGFGSMVVAVLTLIAVLGESGFVEVGIVGMNAAELLGIRVGESIRIRGGS